MSKLRPEQGIYVVLGHEIRVATVLQCTPPLEGSLVAVYICGDKKRVCHTDQIFGNRKDALRWLKNQK